MRMRSLFGMAAMALLLSGCSTTVTNLTPRQYPRAANNLYTFEVALDTTQRSIKDETLKPFVVIGFDKYPMQPIPLLKNRWDAQVPVPAQTNFVYYRFKFDYDYKAIPKPKPGSILSPPYQLEILDK